VEEVGEDCKTNVRKGDAVYGVCHCANHVSSKLQLEFIGPRAKDKRTMRGMVLSQSMPWSRMVTLLRFPRG
jgi:hypothetical protein